MSALTNIIEADIRAAFEPVPDRLTRLKPGTRYVWINALPVPVDVFDVCTIKRVDGLETIRLSGRVLPVQVR